MTTAGWVWLTICAISLVPLTIKLIQVWWSER